MAMPPTPAVPGTSVPGAANLAGSPELEFALLLGNLLGDATAGNVPLPAPPVPELKEEAGAAVRLNPASTTEAEVLPDAPTSAGQGRRPEDLYAPADVPVPLPLVIPVPAPPEQVASTESLQTAASIQEAVPPPAAPLKTPEPGIHLRIRTAEASVTPAVPEAQVLREPLPLVTEPEVTGAASATAPEKPQPAGLKTAVSHAPTAPAPVETSPAPRGPQPSDPLDAAAVPPATAPAPKQVFRESGQGNAGHGSERRSQQEDAPEVTPLRATPAAADFKVAAPELKTHETGPPHRDPAPVEAPAAAREMVPPEPLPRSPLRAVALDFSPDGAGDVRLKLAERAGEVHVTLHASDARLTHELRAGIHDLASVLSSAGYEAEPSPGQQFQQGHQHREQPQQRYTPPQQKRQAGDFGRHLTEDQGSRQ